jgi:hypothetical protein
LPVDRLAGSGKRRSIVGRLVDHGNFHAWLGGRKEQTVAGGRDGRDVSHGTRLVPAQPNCASAKAADAGNADAAGPYDGEWSGTATSAGERCKQAVVKLTVEGQVVLGQAGFERDAPNINGTVDEDGAFGGTIGFQPLRGQFVRDEFEGAFKSFNCEWKALLRRTR